MSDVTPTPDAAVRTARVTDAPDMGALQAQAWHHDYAGTLPQDVLAELSPDLFTTTWQASLQDPPSTLHRALVATEGDRVVGLTAIGPTDEPGVGELLVLTVDPSARRRGHGSRLLNAAVDTLRANDFREIRAWVPATDEQTRTFLQAAGVAPDGAFRDRELGSSPDLLREVRLVAGIVDE